MKVRVSLFTDSLDIFMIYIEIVLCLYLLVMFCVNFRGSPRIRIFLGIIVGVIMLISTIVLAMLDSNSCEYF